MRRNHHDGVRKICDCPRRRWPRCQHPWHFNFRWKSEDYRFSLERRIGRITRTENGKWRRDLATLGEQIISKTDADAEADRLRAAIRSGELQDVERPKRETMTLAELFKLYIQRDVRTRRPHAERLCLSMTNTIVRTIVPRPSGGSVALGEWPVASIITSTIERFREIRRAKGNSGGTINALLYHISAAFNWAIRTGYLDETPFRRGALALIRKDRIVRRDRRLHPGEEQRLLNAANEYMCDIIIAAIETGMRSGEIRSMQWRHVHGLSIESGEVVWASCAEVFLPVQNTKTRTSRCVPISQRLKPVLARRRFDPSGSPMPLDAFVFGTAVGERIADITHSWWATVLRAYGHKRVWARTKLDEAARAALHKIDLHFHDLRREAGSRWMDGGVPLHTVRDWLGHSGIAQTSTYLASAVQTQHDAMRRFDENRRTSSPASVSASGANTQSQGSHYSVAETRDLPVKVSAEEGFVKRVERAKAKAVISDTATLPLFRALVTDDPVVPLVRERE